MTREADPDAGKVPATPLTLLLDVLGLAVGILGPIKATTLAELVDHVLAERYKGQNSLPPINQRYSGRSGRA